MKYNKRLNFISFQVLLGTFVKSCKSFVNMDGQRQLSLVHECLSSEDSKFKDVMRKDEDFGNLMSTVNEVQMWELKTVSDEVLLLTLWNERRMFSGWKQAFHTLTVKERDLLYRGDVIGHHELKFRLLKDLKEKEWPLSTITDADTMTQKDIFSKCQSIPELASLITERSPNSIKMTTLADELMQRHKFQFIVSDSDALWAIAYLNRKCLTHPEMYRKAVYFGHFAPLRKNADPHMQLFLLIQMKSLSRFMTLFRYLFYANRLPDVREILHLLFEADQFDEAYNTLKQVLLQSPSTFAHSFQT